jgi:hypothetical protein
MGASSGLPLLTRETGRSNAKSAFFTEKSAARTVICQKKEKALKAP